LFYLPDTASEADKSRLREGLMTLTQIPVIRQFFLGTPAATDRPVIEKSYTFSWLTLFDDAADEAAYQEHPIHQQFVQEYANLWSRVVVYDAAS
jgi:hypothetical protein